MREIIKILLIAFFLYFSVLIQTSFLVHFAFFGIVFNLIFIFVFFYNIFEDSHKKTGLFCAVLGGFLMDVFSSRFIGFNTLILLALALFIKLFLKKHVRIPFVQSA